MAETVGSLVDKISIMGLKIFHMDEQCRRADVTRDHISQCTERVRILRLQSNDLCRELDVLVNDLAKGKTRLKVYRQFKMYNDAKYSMPARAPGRNDIC